MREQTAKITAYGDFKQLSLHGIVKPSLVKAMHVRLFTDVLIRPLHLTESPWCRVSGASLHFAKFQVFQNKTSNDYLTQSVSHSL